jgi:hypothetical protein
LEDHASWFKRLRTLRKESSGASRLPILRSLQGQSRYRDQDERKEKEVVKAIKGATCEHYR